MLHAKKGWAVVGLMVVLTMALASCATPQPEIIEVEKIVEVEVEKIVEVEVAPEVDTTRVLRTVTYEDWGGAESLDPASPTRDLPAIQIIYNQMIRLDEENFSKPVPDLIESWESDATGLTWTFHVRQGVKFHDGTPLTSADIIYTMRHIVDPEVGSPAAGALEIVDVDRLEAPDDFTVILHLKSGHSDLPLLMTDYRLLVIKDGSADDPDSPDFVETAAIGTGPYMLETFDTDNVTVLVANPDYWEGTPGVDRIELLRIADASGWVRALLAGQVDMLDKGKVGADQLVLFEGTEDFVIHDLTTGEWQNFVMNVNVPPYDDIRVRTAMKLVVDRQEMLDAIVGGQGVIACDSPVWPGDPYFVQQTCEQDIERAIELLAEAGYPDGLDVVLSVGEANPWIVPMAVVYKEQAIKAGIRVEINQVPADGYWSDTWMVLPFVGSHWGERNADQALNEIFKCGANWNEGFWCNEEFDQLLVDARGETDFDKRQELYQRAQLLVSTEAGTINPFFRLDNRVLAANVGGINPDFRNFQWWKITLTD